MDRSLHRGGLAVDDVRSTGFRAGHGREAAAGGADLDRGDPAKTPRILARKFCFSGGVPNTLLAVAKPEGVKAHCTKPIGTIGTEGGDIQDASAIVRNDTTL